jgi:DNA replication and repair protein RecF
MWVEKIKLINFKNHESQLLELGKGWVCISGNNGTGKTNILDAIWFLANCKSYFSLLDQQLILNGKEGLSIKANIVSESEDEKTEYACRMESGKRKKFSRNGNFYKKLSDHLGFIPLVMITPFNIALVYEGSEGRRKYMDMALCKVYPEYVTALENYQKAREYRNKQLKIFAENNQYDSVLLEQYNKVLCKNAPLIHAFRKKFSEEITANIQTLATEIMPEKEQHQIIYHSDLNLLSMEDLLTQNLHKDRILERTTKGIHKDDLEFVINGMPLSKYGSQGQTKSFVICLELALFVWFREKKHISPILLLDDVFEKIDEQRAAGLMRLINMLNPDQIFITDTHKERIENLISGSDKSHFFIHL